MKIVLDCIVDDFTHTSRHDLKFTQREMVFGLLTRPSSTKLRTIFSSSNPKTSGFRSYFSCFFGRHFDG